MTIPFVLLINSLECTSQVEFDFGLINEYKDFVLGGNHSPCAKGDLWKSFPKNPNYKFCQAQVYA